MIENQLKKHKIFGRPRASEEAKRAVKVSVFLTESEAAGLREKCAATNFGVPELLRRAALGRQIEPCKSVFDAQAVIELRDIGQAINEISRALRRAEMNEGSVDFLQLETILREQTSVLHALKMKIIE